MTVTGKIETSVKLEGFRSFHTHHCVSGSMRHIYEFNQHPVSEEMLLGLGEGVSFIYWHQKGQTPFIGGRGSPKPSMEQLAGQRTGVKILLHRTSSTSRARNSLLEMLSKREPVMLQVDMGYLPYFDFGGSEYHFGGHAIVACGYNSQDGTVLVADRDGLYPVPMGDLEKARNSRHKPFPPKNQWYSYDFSDKRLPTVDDIYTAIHNQAKAMIEPPIRNIGVKGIRLAAERIPLWKNLMDDEQLRWVLFNTYIFISPDGGSGGGAFRYMFSRFLNEAAEITGDLVLRESAVEFQNIGDRWQEIAEWAKAASESPNPADLLGDCVSPINVIADLEQAGWRKLHLITANLADNN
jgi:hypothetical protein